MLEGIGIDMTETVIRAVNVRKVYDNGSRQVEGLSLLVGGNKGQVNLRFQRRGEFVLRLLRRFA